MSPALSLIFVGLLLAAIGNYLLENITRKDRP